MVIKINGKKLHLTTFEVVPTGANLKRCLKMQKIMAETQLAIENVDVDNDKSILNSLDQQLTWLDSYTNFLKEVLNLSDDQTKKVADSDFDDVMKFTNEVIDKILQRDNSKSTEDK